MTQDYAVQNKGASNLVWGTAGAVAGAGTGAALANWANFGIPAQAYNSWEEAVAATTKDDEFIKKRIDKAGDDAENWKKLTAEAEGIKSVKDEILQAFPEDARKNADVNQYLDDLAKYEDLLKTESDKVLRNLNEGRTIEGLDKASATLDDDIAKYVTTKVESVKTQKEALETLKGRVKNIPNVTDDIIDGVDVKKLIEKRKQAATNLSETVLETLKKPSLKWTAAIGAVVFAAAALLAKPKNKEA